MFVSCVAHLVVAARLLPRGLLTQLRRFEARDHAGEVVRCASKWRANANCAGAWLIKRPAWLCAIGPISELSKVPRESVVAKCAIAKYLPRVRILTRVLPGRSRCARTKGRLPALAHRLHY